MTYEPITVDTVLLGAYEVMPIGATLNDYHYREGTYYLETSNQAKIKEFISILSQETGKQYHTKYRNSEFKNDGQEIAEPSFDDPDELDDLLKITLIFFYSKSSVINDFKQFYFEIQA